MQHTESNESMGYGNFNAGRECKKLRVDTVDKLYRMDKITVSQVEPSERYLFVSFG